MGARSVCPTCGRSWTGRDVRFCGVCGDHVTATGPPSRRSPRLLAGMLAGSLVLAAAAGLVTAMPRDTAVTGDPRVEIGDEPVEPAGEPLSEQQAEALLQQVDPSRLRCEPRGCEIWRRDREQLSGVAAFGDLVVVLEGGRLAALDAETGAERWQAPVGHLRSVTSEGEQIRATSSRAEIVANQTGDGVYLVTGNEVSLVGADGNRVWSDVPDPGVRWRPVVLDEFLILHGPGSSGDVHRLAALDPATGRTAWTANATSVLVVEPDVIVVATPDRQLLAIDPATGHALWEHRPRLGLWAQSAGPWLIEHRGRGIALLDRQTGREIAALPGYLTEPVVGVGELWLAVITSTSEGGSPLQPAPLVLVALSDGGDTVWQLPLEPDQAWGCCSILVSEDEREVTVSRGAETQRIDAVTGEVVSEEPRDDVDTRRVLQAPDGSILRWRGPGELSVTNDAGGADVLGVDILGIDIRVESFDPLVVGSDDHLVGVRLLPR